MSGPDPCLGVPHCNLTELFAAAQRRGELPAAMLVSGGDT